MNFLLKLHPIRCPLPFSALLKPRLRDASFQAKGYSKWTPIYRNTTRGLSPGLAAGPATLTGPTSPVSTSSALTNETGPSTSPSPASSVNKSGDTASKTSLHKELVQRIKISGPITIADYMKFVLTNPIAGFYMKQDVFGSKGHFTTSPEISQIFGELVAVWLINEWRRFGSLKPLRVVELGPGRGTLAADISRVLAQFSETRDNSSLHMVEISPHLTQIQEQTLCGTRSVIEKDGNEWHHNICQNGIPVTWYQDIGQIPENAGFTAFVSHEFFDALPIHKFQKNDKNEWREVLVDFDDKEQLRYVLSKNPTPGSKMYIDRNEKSSHVEVCPQAALITEKVTSRLNNNNGCFLVCDYGFDDVGNVMKEKDTFRAFRDHKQWDPLKDPGTADLTADVDFGYIKRHVSGKALIFGPVSQEKFLRSLGIEIRLHKLLEQAKNEQQTNDLKTGVNMLINEMGQRFKFLSLFPKSSRELFLNNPPAGFQ